MEIYGPADGGCHCTPGSLLLSGIRGRSRVEGRRGVRPLGRVGGTAGDAIDEADDEELSPRLLKDVSDAVRRTRRRSDEGTAGASGAGARGVEEPIPTLNPLVEIRPAPESDGMISLANSRTRTAASFRLRRSTNSSTPNFSTSIARSG